MKIRPRCVGNVVCKGMIARVVLIRMCEVACDKFDTDRFSI